MKKVGDEILFRGKRLDNGKWVYGYYCKERNQENGDDEHVIIEYPDGLRHPVCSETVGLCLGTDDKNGKKIFADDVVSVYIAPKFSLRFKQFFGVVEWREGIVWVVVGDDRFSISEFLGDVEVVGNIHDGKNLI